MSGKTKSLPLLSVLLLAAVCVAVPARGQKIPMPQKASQIEQFTLPNGISCYLVTNKTEPGKAVYALVQQGPGDLRADGSNLEALPHFRDRKPHRFLRANGIHYSYGGYPEGCEEASIYTFSGVDAGDVAISDTTALMVFDLASICPYRQAVVVSGDIVPAKIKERLTVFSMMVSPRRVLPPAAPYVFDRDRTPEIVRTSNPGSTVAGISVLFRTPRTARQKMGTVQPVITEALFGELGIVLKNRLINAFAREKLPLAEVEILRRSSTDTFGDEAFGVRVTVDARKAQESERLLMGTIATLELNGVDDAELGEAKMQYMNGLLKSSSLRQMGNMASIKVCVDAFVFGAPLSYPRSYYDYLVKKDLEAERETGLFNMFAGSILVSEEKEVPFTGYTPAARDTLMLLGTKKLPGKVKLTLESGEPVTGGTMWTFANGMRVIYKKSDTKDVFSYALLLRGGFSEIPGLESGESAFVSDLLKLHNVAGMSPRRFERMLEVNGISMEPEVTATDLRLTGSAPRGKLELLIKVLLSVANARVTDGNAYRDYREAERLRILSDRSDDVIYTVMDSLMRPDFPYLAYKHEEKLETLAPGKTDLYFNSQFTKLNDGCLVLFGDLHPYRVKSLMSKYLGGFVTSRNYAAHSRVQYRQHSGWATYMDVPASQGGRFESEGIYMSMSTLTPVTSEKYMAMRLAEMILHKRIALGLYGTGFSVDIDTGIELYPMERITLTMTCQADPGVDKSPISALPALRAALSDVSANPVTDAELKTLKASLIKNIEYERTVGDELIKIAAYRYSEGKDFAADYKNRINSVSKEDVRALIAGWDDGAKVEYIVAR